LAGLSRSGTAAAATTAVATVVTVATAIVAVTATAATATATAARTLTMDGLAIWVNRVMVLSLLSKLIGFQNSFHLPITARQLSPHCAPQQIGPLVIVVICWIYFHHLQHRTTLNALGNDGVALLERDCDGRVDTHLLFRKG
jgi:hypothetical protein